MIIRLQHFDWHDGIIVDFGTDVYGAMVNNAMVS